MNSKHNDRFVIGILLLLIGAYYILKYCGINISIFFEGWWCILLIMFGLYKVLIKRRYFAGLLIAGIGLIFFLTVRAIISTALQIPLLLVLLGVLFLVFPKKNE